LVVVTVCFCVPLLVLVAYSFWPTRGGQVLIGEWTLGNYQAVLEDPIYGKTLLKSCAFAAMASVVAIVLAFPFAYFVAVRVPRRWRGAWILAATLPFATSYVIRVYAWLNLFGDEGLLNSLLMNLHLIDGPVRFLGNGPLVVFLTFTYVLFPLAFLSVYVATERINPMLLLSAADLGATPLRILFRVVLPLARTGLLAAFAFCFISVLGDYVTPSLIGGSDGALYSSFLVTKFGFSGEWGFGSALAFVLLLAMLAVLAFGRRSVGAPAAIGQFSRHFFPKKSFGLVAYSLAFVAILYLPIALLVLFAFSRSTLVGFPIEGFSFEWFTTALSDPPLIESLLTSLVVAAWAVPLSLVLGTLAAIPIARSPGRWRSVSIGVLVLPFSLPPLMAGLGILTTLHAAGISRGLWTIVLGHTLLITPVVCFVVLVRLEGIDHDIELAAADLGAGAGRILGRVVIPQVLPAIFAGALLGFAMSMDEVVLTFLVTGTDVTLPLFIYGSLRYGVTPELNALSSMMLALSFAACGLAWLTLRSWRRTRGRRP
jgi:ABC-type spermidine/putrescine transport system permease subunit II